MDLADPRHRELYAYWQEKRGNRIAPRRADIDPLDIPHLLPNLFMFRVEEDPRDYVCTLLGTQLVEVLGRDFTGGRFGEAYYEAGAETLRRDYDRVVDTREPVYGEYDAAWMAKDFIAYRRLLLPLSDDGTRVDRLLGCAFFIPRVDPRTGKVARPSQAR